MAQVKNENRKEQNAKTNAMIQRLVMQSKIMKMRAEQDALERKYGYL